MEYFDVIHNSPSDLYHHALSFCPPSSWLHKYYNSELPQFKVVKGFQTSWGVCSRTVPFGDIPSTLAPWKDTVAVGLWAGDIAILDAVTGVQKSVFSGHLTDLRTLTFSLDGACLVSGDSRGTINLWDTQTGGVIKTFSVDFVGVCSVSISMDNTTIASVHGGAEIWLWDTITGGSRAITCYGSVTAVRFSLTTPKLLTFSSTSGAVVQWNIDNPGPIADRYGLGLAYEKAAFSSDKTCFISEGGGAATVCSSDSGVVIAKLHVPPSRKRTLCTWNISPNGKYIACGASSTILVWDITRPEPHLINTLIGHTGTITSISFSSSLISSSGDQSIRFWQIGTSSTEPAATDKKPIPPTSSPPMTISLQAKYNVAISVDVAGVVRTWDLSTGLCKASFTTPAPPNGKSDVQLVDDRVIFVWCETKKIHIWDTKRRRQHQTTDLTSDFSITNLRISGDGSKVFALDHEYLQALLTQTGAVIGKVRLEGSISHAPLIVDGSRVWVHFVDSQTQGWDFGILSSTPVPLSDTPPDPDRSHLNFIYCAKTSGFRVEDTVTGKEVYQLSGRFSMPTITQWDGRYLVAGYHSGEVLILDFSCMIPVE